jgi:preprotein translocase subunit SecF
MQFLKSINIDFMKQRKVTFSISLAVILIGIISLILHGGPRYGIDFLGGIELRLNFEEPVNIGDIREALLEGGFENPNIKELIGESESGADVIIFVQEDATAPMMPAEGDTLRKNADISTQIEAALAAKFPDVPFTETQKNLVGPKIGAELRNAAILAILIALLMILGYISWRFEFRFAVGAIAALFHDVVITLGIFSLLNYEVNLAIVAAFLTIVGYSLNDTIVVFDRVRENLKVMRREPLQIIINHSINQSLGRTIITSLTTLFVVLFLYFFGGEVIKYFAFAMIIGVLVGTYSSIYVASPVVLFMQQQSESRKAARVGTGVAKRTPKKKSKA